MRVWSGVVLALVVGGAAAWTTYLVMDARPPTDAEAASAPAHPTPAALIATSHPTTRTFEQQVPWIGTVESRSSVRLRALADGRIEAIQAQDQSPVKAGEPVMRLGGPQVEATRTQLRANVDSLSSQLALADQIVERTSREVKDQLATTDRLAAAQQARAALDGKLQDASLALKSFEERLVIDAPTPGVLTNRRVSVGQEVTAGQVLGDVIDANRLRVAASLFPPEGDALSGKAASVRLSQGRSLVGSVGQVLSEASPTGATQVWIVGPQIDGQLRPGQTVGGTITVRTAPAALAVPASAIVYDAQEQPYVIVQKGDDYVRRQVTLGLTQDAWVQVRSGLEQTDSVATQGAYELYYLQFGRQFREED